MSINTVSSSTVKKQLFNCKEPDTKDGLLLRIHHTPTVDYNKEQVLRFLHAAFNAVGNILAISNIRGDIYLVNLLNNKYWILQSFTSCTVLKFSSEIDQDLLVGLSGGDVNIVNIENAQIKNILQAHKDSVIGISFNSKRECLCYSKLDAILWNLKEYIKISTVCCRCDSAIKEIVFMPTSDYIVGYDQDDIISVWDSKNYDIIKQVIPAAWDKFCLKSLAFTRDGRIMVLSGMAPQIAVYSLDIWSIVKILKLPGYCKAVKKVDFISQTFDAGANQLLAVLGTNGIVYIYNMEKDELVTQVMSDDPIKRMELSSDGKYLVNILATGQLFVYSLTIIINNITTSDSVALRENEIRNVILLRKSSSIISQLKKELGNLLEIDKLKLILKEFKEYPSIYRHKIWSQLLRLPCNSQQYNTFVSGKEMHDPVMKLGKAYPLENHMALKNMKILISDIILWCPFFYTVDYLPLFVFPFIEIFKNDPVACFEAVITVIINWCQFWFEYHPLPPLNILSIIENILLESDSMLLSHFAKYDISSQLYAWALLESTFSEVLLSKDWLQLWDHILTNEPSFLLLVPIAYSLCQKNALLSLSRNEHFQQFFHQQNPIDMKRFINILYHLLDNTSANNHPRNYLSVFRPIESEFYPTFDQFPAIFNQQYFDDLNGLKEQKNKLLYTTDNNLNPRRIDDPKQMNEYDKERSESIRLMEMERIFNEETDRDRKYITQQTAKLSKLQDELRTEQEKLRTINAARNVDMIQEQEEHSHTRSLLDGKCSIFNNLRKLETAELANYKKTWTDLNMIIDQLILKLQQQIENSKLKTLTVQTGRLNISRLMADTKKVQHEVENLMNCIKYAAK